MKLSIVIPVYNEAKTIEEIIKRVDASELPVGFEKEIIVINDCSKDDTQKVINDLKDKYKLKIINHEVNEGKGSSVINGFKNSTGDIVVIQDADLEYDPREYASIMAPIINKDADVVFGSRFMNGAPHRVLFWHYIGNKILTTFSNMMTNLNLTDMETCYKMFTRKVVDDIKHKLKSKRFGIEPEITARVKNYRIFEVGISYCGRTYEEGKKIGWKDGFSAFVSIIRFNLFK